MHRSKWTCGMVILGVLCVSSLSSTVFALPGAAPSERDAVPIPMPARFESLTVHNKTDHEVLIENGHIGFSSQDHIGAAVHLYPAEVFPITLEPNGSFRFTYDHLERGRGGILTPGAYFGNPGELREQLRVGKPIWVSLSLPDPHNPQGFIYANSETQALSAPQVNYDLVSQGDDYQLLPTE